MVREEEIHEIKKLNELLLIVDNTTFEKTLYT